MSAKGAFLGSPHPHLPRRDTPGLGRLWWWRERGLHCGRAHVSKTPLGITLFAHRAHTHQVVQVLTKHQHIVPVGLHGSVQHAAFHAAAPRADGVSLHVCPGPLKNGLGLEKVGDPKPERGTSPETRQHKCGGCWGPLPPPPRPPQVQQTETGTMSTPCYPGRLEGTSLAPHRLATHPSRYSFKGCGSKPGAWGSTVAHAKSNLTAWVRRRARRQCSCPHTHNQSMQATSHRQGAPTAQA